MVVSRHGSGAERLTGSMISRKSPTRFKLCQDYFTRASAAFSF